jgi:hypothetical protein
METPPVYRRGGTDEEDRAMRRGVLILSALCLIASAAGAVGAVEPGGGGEEVWRVATAQPFTLGTDAPGLATPEQRRELVELARTVAAEALAHEAAGRLHEAAHAWRSALAVDAELGSDRAVVDDLLGLARVADALGRSAEARSYRDLAQRTAGGTLSAAALAAAAAPLACDGASHDKTPAKADIPNGKWNGFGWGGSEAEAVASVLDQLFGNVCMPSCKETCPDGDPPGRGECQADARVKQDGLPTGQADYGATTWTFKRKGSKVLLTAKGISQFPDGLTVAQKCTKCDTTAEDEPVPGESTDGTTTDGTTTGGTTTGAATPGGAR